MAAHEKGPQEGAGERPAWRRGEPDPTLRADETERFAAAGDAARAAPGGGPDPDPTLRDAGTLPVPPRDAPLFDGRYRVVRTLGAGGFGRVDLVADTLHEDKLLALKIVLPQHQDVREFEGRFRNEIRVLRALQHQGIPQIFNDGRTERGEFYFTMDYVEGVPLDDVLRREETLEPERIVRLVRQLIAVLDYAHARGVVHRDLKPANILLVRAGTPDEELRVLDFGIAKIMRKEGMLSDARTMDTMGPMGTPHYMAPEQVRGKDVDPRADLYALGVLIYHMVSRRFPFRGKTAMEIATARLEQEPEPLDVRDTPPRLRALVTQLLERERDKRPDIAAIERMLQEIASGQRAARRGSRIALAGAALAIALVLVLTRPWRRVSSAEAPPPHGTAVAPAVASGAEGAPGAGAQAPRTDGGERGSAAAAPVVVDSAPPTLELAALPGASVAGEQYLARGAALVGRVRDDAGAPTLATDDGQPVALDPDGGFALELFPGAGGAVRSRALELVARDGAGRETRRALAFHYDPLPPRLALRRGGEACADGAEVVVFDDATEVELSAADDWLAGVTLDGEPLEPGRVTLALDGEASRAFRFEAQDRAGNATRLSLGLRRGTRVLSLAADGAPLAEGEPFETFAASVALAGACDHGEAELWLAQDGGEGRRVAVDGEGRFALPALALAGERTELRLRGPGLDRRWTIVRRSGRLPEGAGWEADLAAGIGADGWYAVVRKGGMRFVLVPPPAQPYAFAGQSIDLARPFYLGETEVTWRQLGARPPASRAAGDDHPATDVSFADAEAFCARLGGRLPRVAEWLHAAAGPERSEYPWAGAWAEAGYERGEGTSPALAHPLDRSWCGALGLAANVSEWCTDEGGAPRLRGGSWYSDPEECRADHEPALFGTDGDKTIGFRVLLPVAAGGER